MNIRSYQGKTFVVASSNTVICDDELAPEKYQSGDNLPPGKNIGDIKVIPQRTEIMVTDVKSDSARHAYVFARPANDAAGSFGWTSAMNLVGGFANETTGFAPDNWQQEPDGNNKTCVDAKALIRQGPPDFASTGNVIPQGSFVIVTRTQVTSLLTRV
jgi:hypothetical protein